MSPKQDHLFTARTRAWVGFWAAMLADVLLRLAQSLKENSESLGDPLTWVLVILGAALFLRQTFWDSPRDVDGETKP